MSNFVDNANATALMGAVEESIANTRIFPGTLDEYDALTPEEKAKYKYIATPDLEVVPKVKTIELTSQTSTSDGKLILTGMGHKMAIVSSRILDDSNNHLIVPFGFCYSTNGDALFVLVDNSTNAIITSSITLSGTMEYIDLS